MPCMTPFHNDSRTQFTGFRISSKGDLTIAMTSSVTKLTTSLLLSHTHGAMTGTLGPVIVVVVVVLLIESELLRASGASSPARRREVLYVAIAPLVFAFSLIVIVRFMDLLRYGAIP